MTVRGESARPKGRTRYWYASPLHRGRIPHHLDIWSYVMEKACFSWHLVLTPTISYEHDHFPVTSCDWEGWRHETKRLLDLSWQTSPRNWSETKPVWQWAFWTSDAWLSSSIAADIKNWMQPPILLLKNEVPAVEPGVSVKRRDHLDGLLPQESVHFLF